MNNNACITNGHEQFGHEQLHERTCMLNSNERLFKNGN